MANIVPAREKMASIGQYLMSRKASMEGALPKFMRADRLIRVALTAISKNPRLLECTHESLALALLESGQLGLEPNGVMGQAYLVPYKNGKTGQYEAQFQPGYRGLVELVLRTGDVSSVDARAVWENDGDRFEYEYGLNPKLVHKPGGCSDPAKLTHTYVVFQLKDGPPKFDVMTRGELEAIRRRSRAKDDGPWVTDAVQMYLKTVVKRGVKLLRMSPEMEAAISKDTAVEIGEAVPLAAFDPAYGDPPEPQDIPPDKQTKAVEEKISRKKGRPGPDHGTSPGKEPNEAPPPPTDEDAPPEGPGAARIDDPPPPVQEPEPEPIAPEAPPEPILPARKGALETAARKKHGDIIALHAEMRRIWGEEGEGKNLKQFPAALEDEVWLWLNPVMSGGPMR